MTLYNCETIYLKYVGSEKMLTSSVISLRYYFLYNKEMPKKKKKKDVK